MRKWEQLYNIKMVQGTEVKYVWKMLGGGTLLQRYEQRGIVLSVSYYSSILPFSFILPFICSSSHSSICLSIQSSVQTDRQSDSQIENLSVCLSTYPSIHASVRLHVMIEFCGTTEAPASRVTSSGNEQCKEMCHRQTVVNKVK